MSDDTGKFCRSTKAGAAIPRGGSKQEKLCLLVMIGVRADGRKELVALTDGYRESTRVVG